MSEGPLIVQSDKTLLLDIDHPLSTECRRAIAPFAELERSPEHIHTYRLTPLSLWNAAAAGLGADAMVEALHKHAKFAIPGNLLQDIREIVSRYGRIRLERATPEEMEEVVARTGQEHTPSVPGLGWLKLVTSDRALLEELARQPKIRDMLGDALIPGARLVDPAFRGVLKQALIHLGYPAQDVAGYTDGAPLPMQTRVITRLGMLGMVTRSTPSLERMT